MVPNSLREAAEGRVATGASNEPKLTPCPQVVQELYKNFAADKKMGISHRMGSLGDLRWLASHLLVMVGA